MGIENLTNIEQISKIGNVPIFKATYSSGSVSIAFTAGMAICADGSPRAYHPDDIGLDWLDNAKDGGKWVGIATDSNGNPYIQSPNDPYPGYYVSQTKHVNPGFSVSDPRRYIDAETVAYVVVPDAILKLGVNMGDKAIVTNMSNGMRTEAIVAELGPDNEVGEGSIKLANMLGVPSNPRGGGVSGDIGYRIIIK